MKTLRIFISSPGDVAEERERSKQVIESLRRRYGERAFLKPVMWEDLPLRADTSFQSGIDLVLSAEHGIDIAIFILWSRFGSLQDGSKHRSGTEREFDLMMAAREQSGGSRPAALVYARSDDVSFGERLRGRSTTEQQELLGQKAMVEKFIAENFQDSTTGQNIRAYHQFDRPVTFSQRLRSHLTELLDEMLGAEATDTVWNIEEQGPPFMGLEAFQASQADVFFGRETETLEARHALREQARQGCAFLMLSGASGSGKSSLARAGVVPAIIENEIDEQVAAWRTVVVTPLELGRAPLAGLLACMGDEDGLPELQDGSDAMADLLEGMRLDPALTIRLRIKDAFSRASIRAGGGIRMLIVVDQMEELFSSASLVEEERRFFLAALEALACSGHVWVLATVRSDFSGLIQTDPTLVRMTEGQGILPLLPPGPDALRRVIEQPARMAGLSFEQKGGENLADRILRDASAHAELLPLLEYLLRELLEQRGPGGVLRWETYEELGGVEGALAKRAEDVFLTLSDPAQEAFGSVFKSLVTIGHERVEDSGDELVRQRLPMSELAEESGEEELVHALIRERLFVAENDPVTGAATVTIAHESLLRVWPRAVKWAAGNRDLLRTRARVADRMRDGSPLLEGDPLLEAAKACLAVDPASFSTDQRGFVERCANRASLAQTRRAKTRRSVMAALAALTLLSVCAAAFALHKSGAESQARSLAEAERQSSEDMLKQVQLQRAEDFFDKGDSSAGIAYLAAVLRRYPDDTITSSRLLSALRDRSHSRVVHGPWTEPEASLIGWDATGESLILHSKRGILRWRLTEPAPDEKPLVEPEITRMDGKKEFLGYETFSPDRSKMLVFHDWAKARLYDVKTGGAIGPMMVGANGWAGWAQWESSGPRATFSADGRWVFPILTGTSHHVYDCGTGEPLGIPLSAPSKPIAAGFHPAGKLMAVGCMDGTVQIHEGNGTDWKVLQTWKASTEFIRKLEFTEEHLFIESGTTLWVHPIKDKVVTEKGAPIENVAVFALSPNGKRIAVGNIGRLHSVTVYSAEPVEPIGSPIGCGAYPRHVAFLADALRVVVTTDKDARVVSLNGDLLLKTRTFANSPKNDGYGNIRVYPQLDGAALAIGHGDGSIQTWSLTPARALPTVYPTRGEHTEAAIRADGKALAVIDEMEGQLTVWDTDKAELLAPAIRAAPENGRLKDVAFRPGTEEVWTAATASFPPRRQAVLRWHWPTGNLLPNRLHPMSYAGIAFMPDGQRMLAVTAGMMQIVAFPEMRSIPGPWDKAGLQFTNNIFESKEGGYFLLREGNTLTRYSFEDGKAKTTFEVGEWASFDTSDTGDTFLSVSRDNTVQIWDAKTGARIGPEIRSPAASKSTLVYDGNSLLVISCQDHGVRLWRYSTGESLGAVMRHPDMVTAIALSPDGRTLATACFDQTIRYWDVPTGRPLSEAARFVGSTIDYLRWLPDGSRVIASGRCPVQGWVQPRIETAPPAWLVDWAEAVGGQKLAENGDLYSLPADAEREFERQAASMTGDDRYFAALLWYYEQPHERGLSPGQKITESEWAASLSSTGEIYKDSWAINQAPQSAQAWSSYLWDGNTTGRGLVFPPITRKFFDNIIAKAKTRKSEAGAGWLMEAQLNFPEAIEKVPDLCKEALNAGLEEPWKQRCHVMLVVSLNHAGEAQSAELEAVIKQPEVLQSLHAQGLDELAEGKIDFAGTTLTTALEWREKVLGKDHADTLASAYAMVKVHKGNKDDAATLALLQRVTDGRLRVLGADHQDTRNAMEDYVAALLAKGDREKTEPYLRKLQAFHEKEDGPDNELTLHWTKRLADLLKSKGHHAEATPIFQQLIDARIRTEGAEHRTTFFAVQDYADSLGAQKDYAAAEAQFRRALAGREKLLGPEHVDTLWSLSGVAGMVMAAGRYEDAEPLYRQLFETRARVFGPTHPDTLLATVNFSECLIHLGKEEAAVLKRLREALPHLVEKRGENDWMTKKAKGFIERLEKKLAPPPAPAPATKEETTQ